MSNLTTETNAIEAHEKAIGYYKATEQFAYKFFMEVKKIRDERYFEELGFSNFEEYCETHFNLTRRFINQKIQIANAWGEESGNAHSRLGHEKSLFLSRLPEPEREEFIQSNPVDEMTTRQLQQAIKEKKDLERQLEVERSKPEKVVQKVVEKIPSDYHRLKDEIENQRKEAKRKEEYLQSVKDAYDSAKKRIDKYESTERRIEALTRQEQELAKQINIVTELSTVSCEIESLLKEKLAPIRYAKSLSNLENDIVKNNLESILKNVSNWLKEMETYLNYTEVEYESID